MSIFEDLKFAKENKLHPLKEKLKDSWLQNENAFALLEMSFELKISPGRRSRSVPEAYR